MNYYNDNDKGAVKYMDEIDYCVICGKKVPLEKDPSVCSDQCLYWFEVEVEFNRAAKEDLKKYNEQQR